ncbi:TPA: bifunctional DNA-formamidopyrimidine glycosylase/DNA-(apurinic or apyrimidinic site) lyase [Candidatus Berkelbacteria bacterium]|uniref:Formamidopyrimidine-DNA glycosidase n=1 Tax=Berkelbacteria bacterium GW2011_GWE1_39_12 TaxID=1618337 RepID=A0A0G4B3F7_9BACT|nr:MAG: formamidopyrimidine-DNA glycosidase [Berkelbacteria bacterium GW2011_GWE1_39_12]HBO60521.1 bifunctional DNA-formamidopyrimidine glycosylase/DNA-(apurinic or apyrimidinic site) lyase [Candidatus Berkelbacteria bacterium]
MPELPEVETIRLGLTDRIIGKKIISVDFDTAKSFQGKTEDVVGSTISGVERRAKLIQIKLSNNNNLLFHLKLTGQLIVIDHSERFAGGHPSHDWHAELPNSNTRIVFELSDNVKLYFNDMRKFGWCKVLSPQAIEAIYEKDYGFEPLDKEFTVEYLLSKAKRIPNRNIKQFLMDQTIAAGMGNIYTDEALFEAGISPLRKIKDISVPEWQKLIDSMCKVLNMGLKYGGTTDSDYVRADGTKGGMQDHLKVYHQTGKPCANDCGGKVIRITVGGRGTHYCSQCQN